VPQPARADIESGVLDAIRTASRRPISPRLESRLVADLGFDSLQLLDMVAELETRFDITIPDDEVPEVRTVADIVDYVMRLHTRDGTDR
jgi:acyl carrier protein